MLIEFSVENFKCFKEKATFSMVADSDLRKLDFDKLDSKDQLLNVAAIYGANASGKSSFTDAIFFLKFFATASLKHIQANTPTFVVPFMLDLAYEDKPTSFEILFLIDNTQYEYKLSLNNEKVLNESLYQYVNEEKKAIFERDEKEIQVFSTNLESEKERLRLEIYKEQTRPNTSFLSVAAHLNVQEIKKPYQYLFMELAVIRPNQLLPLPSSEQLMTDSPQFKEKMLKYFNMVDISVVDIKRDEAKNKLLYYHEALDKTGQKTLVPFSQAEESEGTNRFFNMIGPIDIILKNSWSLIVDELELHLHPLLTQALVSLFSNPKTNPNKAQLIFTTHTTELLVGDNFNLDQIWFVDRKGTPKASELYSLSEFGDMPENIDDNDPELIKRRYLQGRFGAIPHIGGIPEL